MDNWQEWLEPVIAVAKEAGAGIAHYFGLSSQQMHVSRKDDNTFLTQADVCANEIIVRGLKHLSSLPILSEESALLSYEARKNWSFYWLIDPLDGTRGFIERSEEFTVNIALIHEHQPVMGVVYVPMQKCCYFAIRGKGAYKQSGNDEPRRIQTRQIDWSSYHILFGRYLRNAQLPDWFSAQPGVSVIRLNSSLKLCWIAEGKGDIYPRLGETSEWDTAATQCVVEAAGGAVLDFNEDPLQYNTRSSVLNPPFVVIGDPKQKSQIIQLIQTVRSAK